jgi:hypothetical protein
MMNTNKKHMVPQNVIDCAEKLDDPYISRNIRDNFVERLEVIKEYCEEVLMNYKMKKRK